MPKRLLIVDDDPVIIRILEVLLSNAGYDISTSFDGLDALVKIKKEQPDLVLLDIMMPEINGYDVCYQLRFNDDFEEIPIILLTEMKKELDSDLSQRVDIDYVPKPVDRNFLLEKVKKMLAE